MAGKSDRLVTVGSLALLIVVSGSCSRKEDPARGPAAGHLGSPIPKAPPASVLGENARRERELGQLSAGEPTRLLAGLPEVARLKPDCQSLLKARRDILDAGYRSCAIDLAKALAGAQDPIKVVCAARLAVDSRPYPKTPASLRRAWEGVGPAALEKAVTYREKKLAAHWRMMSVTDPKQLLDAAAILEEEASLLEELGHAVEVHTRAGELVVRMRAEVRGGLEVQLQSARNLLLMTEAQARSWLARGRQPRSLRALSHNLVNHFGTRIRLRGVVKTQVQTEDDRRVHLVRAELLPPPKRSQFADADQMVNAMYGPDVYLALPFRVAGGERVATVYGVVLDHHCPSATSTRCAPRIVAVWASNRTFPVLPKAWYGKLTHEVEESVADGVVPKEPGDAVLAVAERVKTAAMAIRRSASPGREMARVVQGLQAIDSWLVKAPIGFAAGREWQDVRDFVYDIADSFKGGSATFEQELKTAGEPRLNSSVAETAAFVRKRAAE